NGTDWLVAQEPQFLKLNRDMVLGAQPGQAVRDVISDMYPALATTQNQNSQVPGWSGTTGSPSQKDMYRDVIAASCRNCHNSLDTSIGTTPTPTYNDWDSATGFPGGSVGSFVCTLNVMPHALITHRRFWLSFNPHQAQ